MSRDQELSDQAWERIAQLLPAQYGQGRPLLDHCQVIKGIVFRYRAGIAWRDLPERFGPWQTAWKRHHRFSRRHLGPTRRHGVAFSSSQHPWHCLLPTARGAGRGEKHRLQLRPQRLVRSRVMA